jgi:hypothetical protein
MIGRYIIILCIFVIIVLAIPHNSSTLPMKTRLSPPPKKKINK